MATTVKHVCDECKKETTDIRDEDSWIWFSKGLAVTIFNSKNGVVWTADDDGTFDFCTWGCFYNFWLDKYDRS